MPGELGESLCLPDETDATARKGREKQKTLMQFLPWDINYRR